MVYSIMMMLTTSKVRVSCPLIDVLRYTFDGNIPNGVTVGEQVSGIVSEQLL